MPPRIADPRCAELEQMLGNLAPRRELAYRYALRGLSDYCRGDRRWAARVAELERRLKLGEDAMAKLLREAAAISRQLLADAVDQGG
jgi:hypothetical protein